MWTSRIIQTLLVHKLRRVVSKYYLRQRDVVYGRPTQMLSVGHRIRQVIHRTVGKIAQLLVKQEIIFLQYST